MELLTNGLITDSRSFFADRPDFFQKYQQQGNFPSHRSQTWAL